MTTMACKNTLALLKLPSPVKLSRVQVRHYPSKFAREQDPQEVKDMPVFQYATENTKKNKRVYMWGNAQYGALGHASFVKPIYYKHPVKSMRYPWRLPFADFHRVKDVACGYGFTVFAATNEQNDFSLFGVGLNTDFQIGYQCGRKNYPLEIVAEAVPITLPLYNLKTKAVKVACGRAHTVVVTDKEGIFSLGNNSYGQCGVHGSTKDQKENLIKINKVRGIEEEVSQIICGQDHTLVLTTLGQVYSFGWGADGQTGLGNYSNQFTPSLVKGDIEGEKIIQISCAADCVLAVSEKGDVFGWGNSEYNQLNSATDQQQINLPKHLKLNVGKVIHAASGGTICAVVNEKGNVYVWGYGILGQGPNVTSSKKPVLLPEPLFGANEFNTNVRVKQVECGLSHFAALTNHNHLYMWGKNKHDCLGLGKQGDQFFPFKVPVPAEVIKISCGVDHTAVLCRSFS